jgi:alkanesulfonate monooxygenase SsuD/methylene tetrahydromethanopterin reductase-like flavin-dependent oxidoreductase (luciferase family)
VSVTLELGLIWMPSDIQQAIRIARLAEEGGFSTLGICDSPILYHEVYPVVAACLAATESIRIGPNVTNPVTRHWTIHAASMRANDRLAPGRATLGIGAGDGAVHTLGLRPADGRTLERAVREIRQAAPGCGEIHIAAGGPKRARLAGRVGDAALLGTGLDAGALRSLGEAVDAGQREAPREGRRVQRWAMAHLNVVADEADVEAAREATKPLAVTNARHAFSGSYDGKNVPLELQRPFRERLASYRFMSHAVPGRDGGNAALLADRPDLEEYAMQRFTIVGTAEQCRARVARLAEESDLDGVWFAIVVPDPETLVERATAAFADLLGR